MSASTAHHRLRSRWGMVVAGALLAGTIALGATGAASATSTTPDISGWAPWWTPNGSLTTFKDHVGMFSEISPFGFSVTDQVTIVPNAAWTVTQLQAYKDAARPTGARVIPTLADATPALAMADILADPAARAQHVQAIVALIIADGFDGVDLDYEGFAFNDPHSSWATTSVNWVLFLTDLSAALHAQNLTLEVSVPAIYDSGQTSKSGYWVYNYAGMAGVVDRIKIMAYEFSGATPGPMAPISWDTTILTAARALVPASKIVLGIPAYGKDWVTSIDGSCPTGSATSFRSVTSKNAPAVAFAHGKVPIWDPTRMERTFNYYDNFTGFDAGGNFVSCNVFRTVWYMDAQGMYARVALAKANGIAGVSFWALSGEEPIAWAGITAATQGVAGWTAPAYPVPAPAPPPPPATFSPGTSVNSLVHVPWTMRQNTSGDKEQFAVGADQQIYHQYTIRGSFTAWSPLGGLPGGVGVSSHQVSWGSNYLNNPELYVTGVDGNVYHDYTTPGAGSGWSGWSSLGQPAAGAASDVQVGRNYLGNQEMYIVGRDGSVYHRFATPGQGPGWSGWDTLGAPAGTTVADGVHVGHNFLGNQELYVVGANGTMYHNFATPGRGSGWNGWDPMAPVPGISLRGDLNVGLNYLGNQELYFVGSDNQVYHNYSTPGEGSGWSSFSPLGTPSGLTLDGDLYLEAFDYRVVNFQDLVVFGTNSAGLLAAATITSTPGVGSGWSKWTPDSRPFLRTDVIVGANALLK